MARRSGVSPSTPFNLLVDAGAVYINYGELDERLLGATRGGNTFKVNTDYRVVEADGIPGAINAMVRIINVEVMMTVRMLELSAENLLIAFPGATSVAAPIIAPALESVHSSIRRARNIEATDFMKNIAMVGTIQGKAEPIICILYNAMQSDNIELGTADDDESVIELNFRGHFDLSDLDKEPWEILYPSEADPTP